MNPKDLIRKVAREAGTSRAELARMSGLSEAVLLAWTQGTRTPRRRSLDRLASGLEARAGTLLGLAAKVRETARAGADDREAAENTV